MCGHKAIKKLNWLGLLFITACLALVNIAHANALVPLKLNSQSNKIDLKPHLELLEDKPGRLALPDVVRADGFQAVGGRSANFGFTPSAWWVRLQLENTDDHDLEFALRQDYVLIDRLDIYLSNHNGGWREIHTGDRTRFDTRPLAHQSFIIPLQVRAGETQSIYLRFQTSGSMNIGLSLYNPKRLTESISKEQLAYGAYYGGFGVLLFYNFFIFLAVRDRSFFFYLIYLASYGLYFGVHNGLSFQYLWPNNPDWGNQALLVLLALSLVFGLSFARHFLDSPKHMAKLDWIAWVCQWLSVLGLLLSFFLPYAKLIVPMAILTIVSVLTMFLLGVVGVVQGYKPARYFMIAWIALIFGVLAYMLKTFGLLPHNALTQNGFQVGALMEMVLLSLALGERVNELQRQTLTDALTKLNNRRYFDRQLELTYAQSQHGAVALMLVDIDFFKKINDRYGHAKGDEVLIELAKVLRDSAPGGATVCRFGGEEFAIILPSAGTEYASAVAEKIRAAVERHFNDTTKVTVSIGLATTTDHKFTSQTHFFNAADGALYRAKEQGRNRVVCFDGRED